MRISDMTDAQAGAFKALNEAWIGQHFVLEDADRRALGDPMGKIVAGATDNLTSTSSGTSDAGVITYSGGCRFNWSKIQSGATWSFSIGGASTSCGATVNSQNSSTGAYSVTFTLK